MQMMNAADQEGNYPGVLERPMDTIACTCTTVIIQRLYQYTVVGRMENGDRVGVTYF